MIFSKSDDRPRWVSNAKWAFFEGFYSVGSVVASVAVLWWFMPLWLTTVMVAVLVMHELAHYFAAIALGEGAYMPFFIPVVITLLGGTYVIGEDPVKGIKIAMAGPTVGALTAAVIAVAALIVGFMPAFWAGSWMLAFQGYSAVLGSDGRRKRRFQRAISEFQSGLASV